MKAGHQPQKRIGLIKELKDRKLKTSEEIDALIEPQELKCPHCFRYFVSEQHLERHLISHDKRVCMSCGARFMQDVILRQHALQHSGETTATIREYHFR